MSQTPAADAVIQTRGELWAFELLSLFMADLQTLKTENLGKWFDEASELCLPPCEPARGTRKILAIFGLIFRRYKELSWSVTAAYPAGERKLVYQTESKGTFTDGRPYANSILTIIEFTPEGKIRFLSDYFKNTAIFDRPLPALNQTDQKPVSDR